MYVDSYSSLGNLFFC